MKLPNDLIKATDYDKAKDRIIKEFDCVNGKIIQHYALGGEHELTMQEIIDCLNALATIDCDLQTAYAYIKGQEQKIADLEAKLAEKDKEIERVKQEQTNYYRFGENVKKVTIKTIDGKNFDVYNDGYQDKISFAVEQLEKVKEYADIDYRKHCYIGAVELDKFIDNQIKQLKEMQ